MKSVYKYNIPTVDGVVKVLMPEGAQLMHVAFQGFKLSVWTLVDVEKKPTYERNFLIVGTGETYQELNAFLKFVGTAHLASSDEWYHVFEVLG